MKTPQTLMNLGFSELMPEKEWRQVYRLPSMARLQTVRYIPSLAIPGEPPMSARNMFRKRSHWPYSHDVRQ